MLWHDTDSDTDTNSECDDGWLEATRQIFVFGERENERGKRENMKR